MKTRTLIPVTALALLLAACVAPMPTTPKLQLPGSEKPQLPLEQQTKKTNPLELPASPAQPRESVEIQVPALPADELRDFGQIRAAEEQKYTQPLPKPMLPADELRDFGQIRVAEEQKYSQPLPRPMLPADELRDFGQIRAAEEQKYSQPPVGRTDPSAYPFEIEQLVHRELMWSTDPSAYPAEIEQTVHSVPVWATDPSAYPAEIEQVVNTNESFATDPSAYPAEIEAVVHPVSEAVMRYQAQRELYQAGYQPPNAMLSPNQLLNSAMYRYPVLRQIHRLPVLDKSGQVDRYTAMKQLYEAGYQPPNALLDNIR
jgi:hypothetical protein